jgi:hypothetical protein
MDDVQGADVAVSAADTARLLLEFHKENTTFVRHYEEIRFKFSQLTVTLAAAPVGLSRLSQASTQGVSAGGVIPICIMFLGAAGLLITLKYTERADRHATICSTNRGMPIGMPRLVEHIVAHALTSLGLSIRWISSNRTKMPRSATIVADSSRA